MDVLNELGPMWYLDDNNTPQQCTFEEYSKHYKEYEAKRMAKRLKTTIGECEVSTVFLSHNHSYTDGPPVLWETLVFGGNLAGERDRYTSYDDALEGHKNMVVRVMELN